MSPGDIVALIVGLFFAVGVIVGIIAVIALSAIRRDRALSARGSDPSVLREADEAGYHTGASGVAGHWDGITTDGPASTDRSRWPGDTDGGSPGGTS
ncbi:MAG TPA: hypothetical protein VFB06_27915 [Streptosporangiaceae bacterium]|nr:hypothetical protein [Streptosporangiaceae bacterium]